MMEFVLEEICHIEGEVLPWNFVRGGAIFGLPYGIISPWGSSAMVFIPGEGLLYGIPSGGTFAMWYYFSGDNLSWYLFPCHEICVWGRGERFIIEGKLYHMVLFPPWGSSAIGFLPGEGNACLWIEQIQGGRLP